MKKYKKYIIYATIIIGEMALFSLVSKILDISTHNTWLADVAINVVFITICVMLFGIAKSKRGTFISLFIYFVIFLSIIVNTIITISSFLGI